MATLASIEVQIAALATAVAAITPSTPADNIAILAAIADLKTEVVNNVEGAPPTA